jgi:hypothetical protein
VNEKTDDTGREMNRKDTTPHSGSKAPETRNEAEEREGPSDDRLRPGGTRGAAADVGMTNVDRDTTVSGGRTTGQERHGETREE